MDAKLYNQLSLAHIRYLSNVIGGRGSCTSQVKKASEYVADQLEKLGAQTIQAQPFEAIPSTYLPYALSFGIALLGSLLALSFDNRFGLVLAASLNTLGFWGMIAETEFTSSWIRWFLPKADTQNILGVVPPTAAIQKRVVLNAHLDTHRTPVFYSSRGWHTLFSVLVGFTLLSMAMGAVIFGISALFAWRRVCWLSLVLAAVEIFALVLCLHADFTPFSPGANDNASGVAVILGLAKRLVDHPLSHTEVHLVFTDCEEVGAYGIQAFLDAYATVLGPDTIYIILDEVGNGTIKYLTVDGLVLKHKTHPLALELAQTASNACPEIGVYRGMGIAYTDALPVTKRGLIALTLCTLPPPGSGEESHWHQMSDTFEHIKAADLALVHRFTWEILQIVDSQISDQGNPLIEPVISLPT
jgi:hypothetical protein